MIKSGERLLPHRHSGAQYAKAGEQVSEAAVEVQPAKLRVTSMPLTGHRILLVEDEVLIAFEIRRGLQAAHGEVVGPAATVAKAIKLADTHNLSLAVLDFRLRFENSLPVAAKLHAAGVPFIFYTANDHAVLPAAWPCVPVISKPASPTTLVRALVSVLNASCRMDGSRVA